MGKKVCVAVFDKNKNSRYLIEILAKKIVSELIFLEAEKGLDAIQLINNNDIDLCFVNFSLPVVGGVEVAKILKEKNKNVRIVALYSSTLNYEIIKNDSNFDSSIEVATSVKIITEEITNFIADNSV